MLIIFIYTLYQVLHFQFNTDSFVDTAVFCTSLTVVGGILGTAIIQYFKKSATENIPKIQTSLYKDTMDIRLEYNEKMMELKHKYNMTNDDIYEIENNKRLVKDFELKAFAIIFNVSADTLLKDSEKYFN